MQSGNAALQEPASIRENFSRILSDYHPSAPLSSGGEQPHYGSAGGGGGGGGPLGVLPPSHSSGSDAAAGLTSGAFMGNFYADHPDVQQGVPWDEPPLDVMEDEEQQKMRRKKKSNMVKVFPFFFSFSCLIIFLTPIWTVVNLSADTNVVYWIGDWCKAVVVLPAFFVGAFSIQAQMKRPHKLTILITMLLPAGILLVTGDALASLASDRADQLRSTDCDTFKQKRDLQHAWEAAQKLYTKCLVDTVHSNNITMKQAKTVFRIEDCSEYKGGLAMHPSQWGYLKHLEDEYQCSGWCHVAQPVFTKKDVRDSCSVVVGAVFRAKIKRAALQVVSYDLFILMVVSIGNIMAGPHLRSMGIEW
mmetsp:Transcript_36679/g.72573  ORF Transcript_36679/g.72573 Transcript_36679/m.72573 type:complete len:360 (-) Transcript_36679:92-1171(-)